MKFFLTLLLLFSASFGLTACGEKDDTAAAAVPTTPQLVLNPPDIYSWKRNDAGFSVQLTETAGKQLTDLIAANPDKPVDVFIRKQKIATQAAGEAPSDGRTLALTPDEQTKEKVLLLLPAEKENP